MKKLGRFWCKGSIAAFLAAVLILPVGVKAGLVQYSVTVIATDGAWQQTKTFSGEVDTGINSFVWELAEEYIFEDDAAIESLKLTMDADPEVGVEFGVRAGILATTFKVLSDVVSFDPLVNPMAYSSAGITLTDRLPVGATITGFFPGDKVHQARYNGSAVFANLVSGFSISGGTLGIDEAKPPSGSEIISDTLTSIESEFWFRLSARDSASGTSTFVVIPEPATVGVLTIGAVLVLLKKQRR